MKKFRRSPFFGLLSLCAFCFFSNSSARAQIPGAASPSELAGIQTALASLERGIAAKDPNALRFFGLSDDAAKWPSLLLDAQIAQLAVSPAGALVRQNYRVSGATPISGAPVTLASGTHEFWLARGAGDKWSFSDKRWTTPDDDVAGLMEAAREEWSRPAAGRSTAPANSLLHLVAARRGGRWIALRRSRWDGALLDARALQNLSRAQNLTRERSPDPGAFDPNWLRAQMANLPAGAGEAHFILQRSATGWIGLGAAWDEDKHFSTGADRAAMEAKRTVQSTAYGVAAAHKTYALALAQIGLWSEAADELEKTEHLQPGLAGTDLLRKVQAARNRDPETLAASQLQTEARVGLDPNHPSYLVSALVQDYTAQPSILRALRLGLEYSRLGDDTRAGAWLDAATELSDQGGMRDVSPSDAQWIGVLGEHLRERRRLLPLKPTVIIRSPLFTLRCFSNDFSAIQTLAALEAAQHTVYSDFGIPMGSTEVLAWRSQDEFQRYTTKFSAQGQSEFVAALTLTKLIATRNGPVVLGEEINVFSDPRMTVFSTVAHEYGHVAVRQLSKGRDVPVWFNEGIATSVEGGYDGYLERVRNANRARALLTMDELIEWDVDGERAFLAYSEANSIIDFIVATWGKDAVLNILRQIGEDTESETAFQNVLGISQHELWRRWAASLKG